MGCEVNVIGFDSQFFNKIKYNRKYQSEYAICNKINIISLSFVSVVFVLDYIVKCKDDGQKKNHWKITAVGYMCFFLMFLIQI